MTDKKQLPKNELPKGQVMGADVAEKELEAWHDHRKVKPNHRININEDIGKDNVREKISSQYEKSYETIGLRKDGSKFKVEINAKKIKIDDKIVRVAVCRDISAKKKSSM